tara:strand:- start:5473 stop:6729 length:1257 start_codon:yes stop_codon:yes gene_type:complete
MSRNFERIIRKILTEDELTSLSLQEGKMYFLLNEALDQSDIEELRASLDETEDSLSALDTAYGGAGIKISDIPGAGEYAKSLAGAVGKARGIVAKLDLEDPKWSDLIRKTFGQGADANGVARAVTAIQAKASEFHSAVTTALDKVVANLEPVFKDDKELWDQPLNQVLGTQENMPSIEDFKDGISKAIGKGGPKKGAMAKLGGWVSGVFKRGDPVLDKITGDLPDELDLSGMADYILSQPLSALKGAAESGVSDDAPPPLPQDVISDVTDAPEESGTGEEGEEGEKGEKGEEGDDGWGSPVGDLDALPGSGRPNDPEAEGDPNAPEEEPESQDDVKDAEGYVITKADLKAIKGAMDKAKGQKKSQSKALGGHLNQLLGQTLFAENRSYTMGGVKRVLSEHIEKQQAMSRWLKIAGIKK